MAARAPERYHAYIGMGQVAHQQKSEVLAYEYALDRFSEAGDVRMVRRLEAAPVTMDAPLPTRVHEGARRGHAQPRRRHDA